MASKHYRSAWGGVRACGGLLWAKLPYGISGRGPRAGARCERYGYAHHYLFSFACVVKYAGVSAAIVEVVQLVAVW